MIPAVEPLTIDDEHGSTQLAVHLEQPARSRPGAPVLLYLHGFASRQSGEKATFFRRAALEAGLAFCSFDFRGHGESGGGMLKLTLTRNLADVAHVCGWLREHGFERPILFGSSMGGGTALWYAALHPEQIAAAVHVAPAIQLEDGLLRWVGEEGARAWHADGRYQLRHELGSHEVGWELIEDLRRYDLARLQELYRTPTLLFQGKNDTSVPWHAVVDFATGCSYEGIELHLFADGDHRLIGHLDHLWQLTLAFLKARGVLAT